MTSLAVPQEMGLSDSSEITGRIKSFEWSKAIKDAIEDNSFQHFR